MLLHNGYEFVDQLAERLGENIVLLLRMTDKPLRGQVGEHRHHDEAMRAFEDRGGLCQQRGAVSVMLLVDLRAGHGQILSTALSKISVSLYSSVGQNAVWCMSQRWPGRPKPISPALRPTTSARQVGLLTLLTRSI